MAMSVLEYTKEKVVKDMIFYSTGAGMFLGLVIDIILLPIKEWYPINVLLLVMAFWFFIVFTGLDYITIDKYESKLFKDNIKRLSVKIIICMSAIIISFMLIIKISGILITSKNAFYALLYFPVILFWSIDVLYMRKHYIKLKIRIRKEKEYERSR